MENDPIDLSKLNNLAKNDVKKTVYDKLVTKISDIDITLPYTCKLVFKTQYDSDKQNLEKKFKNVDK